jgi:Flp pilus assembly protein TadB
MGTWVEIGQIVLAIAVFAYIFYLLAFSGREEARRQREQAAYRGFERRELERIERRAAGEATPPAGQERRHSPRRGKDL